MRVVIKVIQNFVKDVKRNVGFSYRTKMICNQSFSELDKNTENSDWRKLNEEE